MNRIRSGLLVSISTIAFLAAVVCISLTGQRWLSGTALILLFVYRVVERELEHREREEWLELVIRERRNGIDHHEPS